MQDIAPYDYNRVRLKPSISNIDFINASGLHRVQTDGVYDSLMMHPYLPSEQIAMFIAQDPNESTMDHYLQMIYEQQIEIVVRFSNENETMMLRDEFDGPVVSKKMLRRFKITEFPIKEIWDVVKQRDRTNKVIYYRFTGWNGSEELSEKTAQNMLTAITQIRNEIGVKQDMMTMLVHDEEGGASGASAFVCLWHLLEKVDNGMFARNYDSGKSKEGDIYIIYEIVDNLRSKRIKMIRCLKEYSLLFQSLVHYVQHKGENDTQLNLMNESIASPMNPNEIDAEYVVHEPEKHEYFDSYKVYDYTGGKFIENNICLDIV